MHLVYWNRRQPNSSNSTCNIYNWDVHLYTSEAAFLLCEESAVVRSGPPAAPCGLSLRAGWDLQSCVPSRATSWSRHPLQVFGQMVLQMWTVRNLRWLSEIWGLTWHTLHGWVRKIPSCLENITCFDQLWYLHGPVPRAGYLGCSCNEKQETDLWSTANLVMQVSKLVIPLWQSVGSGEHLDLTEL